MGLSKQGSLSLSIYIYVYIYIYICILIGIRHFIYNPSTKSLDLPIRFWGFGFTA